jgi:hypothetical protein
LIKCLKREQKKHIIIAFVHMKGWKESSISVWYLKWEWFLIKLPIGFSTSSFTNIWQLSGVPDKLPLRKRYEE